MAESIANNYLAFTADSNVKFLQGTQANLNSLITNKNAIEGAFYLTNDTHRLYVGRKVTGGIIPAPVNQGVTTVADINALPDTANVGDFYYAEGDNVLAVCSDTKGTGASRTCSWVQMNTNSHITSDSLTQTLKPGSGANANQVEIETNIKDSSDNETTDSWTLIGGSNVTLTVDTVNKTISVAVKDTTYTLSTVAGADDYTATIRAHDNTAADASSGNQDIELHGTRIKVKRENDGHIELTGQEISGVQVANPTSGNGWEVEAVVDGVAAGTSATIDPVIAYGSNGSQTVHFTGNSKTATLSVYTITETDNAISTAINGLEKNINAMKFRGILARATGTSTDRAALDWAAIANDLHDGDVFKVGNSFVLDAITHTGGHKIASEGGIDSSAKMVHPGDTLIVTGTEDTATGVITSGLEVYLIPSGDEDSYYGEFTNNTNTLRLIRGINTEIFGFTATAGDFIEITTTNETGNSDHKILTIAHEDVTRTDTATAADSLVAGTVLPEVAVQVGGAHTSGDFTFWVLDHSAITNNESDAITTDKGHVTGVKLKQIKIRDTHNYISTMAIAYSTATVAGVASAGKMTLTIEDADQAEKEVEMGLESNTLTYSAGSTTNSVKIDFNWGTF